MFPCIPISPAVSASLSADVTDLSAALGALHAGRPIVIPTDTVYGLAARFDLPAAVAALFAAKGRPDEKALPVLGASREQLDAVATFAPDAERLATRFWPGPLTLVLPRTEGFSHDLGGEDADTVAVRVPANDTTLELLRMSGPLAVTSANLSGEPPCATVAEARSVLGENVAVYVDGGELRGSPSTVVSLVNGIEVLRPGAVSEAEIASMLSS